MTLRLYYTDAYCTSFSARVLERLTWDDRPGIVLDCTAFYPASGGQPADRGTLGGVPVLDVIARQDDDAVIHVLDRRLPDSETEDVEGEIDWPRRLDHMQQHTGQHMLSAAFERLFDADTVGFHLGEEISTVDIAVSRLEWEAAVAVEDMVNRVVWEDRSVDTRFVSEEELASLALRRQPVVKSPVRIVEVVGFDANPCGGTHVAHTGEIGLVKIVRLDYRGDETRVEFLCGLRALRDYRAKGAAIDRLTARLTVGYWELEGAVERLQDEAKRLRQELRRARKQLLEAEADELAETAVLHGPHRVAQRVWGPEKPPAELRALAQALMQRPGLVALLAGVDERVHMCFSRADDVNLDVSELLREACAQLGGRGGGQPRLAQGSAPAAEMDRIETILAQLLTRTQNANTGTFQ
jgi:alanyl-tRNA synthetase